MVVVDTRAEHGDHQVGNNAAMEGARTNVNAPSRRRRHSTNRSVQPHTRLMSRVHWLEVNRAHWAERTAIHMGLGGYSFSRLRAGEPELLPIELDELGDEVRGKTFLHLQCHVGRDTLSWARLGATVTGADFDPSAIEAARELAADLDIDATFVTADVYDLPRVLSGRFDIVFTSYGSLCWLPDMTRWAEVIAHFAAPGGVFYMVEFHPLAFALADRTEEGNVVLEYPYLQGSEPLHFAGGTDYANRDVRLASDQYLWNHGLGDVGTSLVHAGLTIEFLHEFPVCASAVVPALQPRPDGYYELPWTADYPLSYSLRARKL